MIIGLLLSLLSAALFTRLYRLGTPDEFYFDETQAAATAQEVLNGSPAAWEFIGNENTHPPLGKLLIAGGMALFGDNPFGWRFLGAREGPRGDGAAHHEYLNGAKAAAPRQRQMVGRPA